MNLLTAFTLALAQIHGTRPQDRPCDSDAVVINAHAAFPIIARASQTVRPVERQQLLDEAEALLSGENTTWTTLAEARIAVERDRDSLVPGFSGKAFGLLVMAVQLDASNTYAICDLVEQSKTRTDTTEVANAMSVLMKARAKASSTAADYAIAKLATRLDMSDLLIADELLKSSGDPRVTWLRARALTQVHGGMQEAYRMQQSVIAEADAALLDTLFDDVRLITTHEQQVAWRKSNAGERRRFLLGFWDLPSARLGLKPEERIAEHYTRMSHVDHWYPVSSPFRRDTLRGALDTLAQSRREAYLRYGAPSRVIRTAPIANGVDSNNRLTRIDSWVYNTGGSPLIMHFSVKGVTDQLAIPGCNSAENLATIDGRIGALFMACHTRSDFRDQRQRDLATELTKEYNIAFSTHSYRPFTKDLVFAYATYSFADTRADTLTHMWTVVGLPISVFSGRGSATFQASVILMDSARNRVIRRDTILRIAAPNGATSDAILQFYLDLYSQPGPYEVRVMVRDSADPHFGRTMGKPVTVLGFSGNRIGISDLMIVQPDSGGSWRRAALALTPVLSAVQNRFGLYYEVYGIPANAKYSTEVEISPIPTGVNRLLRRTQPAMSFKFDDVAPVATPLIPAIRWVTHELKPGEYRLLIRIHHGSRAVEREVRLHVIT